MRETLRSRSCEFFSWVAALLSRPPCSDAIAPATVSASLPVVAKVRACFTSSASFPSTVAVEGGQVGQGGVHAFLERRLLGGLHLQGIMNRRVGQIGPPPQVRPGGLDRGVEVRALAIGQGGEAVGQLAERLLALVFAKNRLQLGDDVGLAAVGIGGGVNGAARVLRAAPSAAGR